MVCQFMNGMNFSVQRYVHDVLFGRLLYGCNTDQCTCFFPIQKRKQQSKNFAAFGPTSFKSRSLQGKQYYMVYDVG